MLAFQKSKDTSRHFQNIALCLFQQFSMSTCSTNGVSLRQNKLFVWSMAN